jgi:hypothetical protein
MHPEMPWLAAGGFAIVGGGIKEGKWNSSHLIPSVIGTIGLVIFASATADTKAAPLVRAVGFLFLLATVSATVRAVYLKKKK